MFHIGLVAGTLSQCPRGKYLSRVIAVCLLKCLLEVCLVDEHFKIGSEPELFVRNNQMIQVASNPIKSYPHKQLIIAPKRLIRL